MRRTEDGSRVKTYEAFVTYLKHKYALSVDTLPFEGKNKVLYSLGSQTCYERERERETEKFY